MQAKLQDYLIREAATRSSSSRSRADIATADQWTSEQIAVFNKRKQPVVTYNRIGSKIDGICGLVEHQSAEPRAFPRSPQLQQGADLATAALRAALEQAKWKRKIAACAETGAVDGIGGVELNGANPDGYGYDVGLETGRPIDFFYDPRSRSEDFCDARYMGMGKWIDAEVLKDQLPGQDEEIEASIGHGDELTSDAERREAAGRRPGATSRTCAWSTSATA